MIRRGKTFCLDIFYLDRSPFDGLLTWMTLCAKLWCLAPSKTITWGYTGYKCDYFPECTKTQSVFTSLPYETAGIFLSFVSKKSKMSINDAEVKKQVSICSIFLLFICLLLALV